MNLLKKDEILLELFHKILQKIQIEKLLVEIINYDDFTLNVLNRQYKIKDKRKVYVIGAGKATAYISQALEKILGDRIDDGLIVVKHNHTLPLNFIKQYEAAHPIPDITNVKATNKVLELLTDLRYDDLIIILLSGGASALWTAPAKGLTLEDLQIVNRLLLESGMPITEINIIRKHLSRIKGGKLVKYCYPAEILTLILSDVIGDNLEIIASAPTVYDTSTLEDVKKIILHYGLKKQLPKAVNDFIELAYEKYEETENYFDKVQNVIIGNNAQALQAAYELITEMNAGVTIIKKALEGEANQIGKKLIEYALQLQSKIKKFPHYIIQGGETTVTLGNTYGKGGRNQELALSAALRLEGCKGITLLSAGTDGTDGPTDATGAIINGNTISKLHQLNMNPMDYLMNHNSYEALKAIGGLIFTGATGTNVMDLVIIRLDSY